MGVEVQILTATLEHAEMLAPLLREGDIEEGRALGLEPREALIKSVQNSEVAKTAFFGGEIASMVGVVPLEREALGAKHAIWMLSGRACARHPKEFLRTSRVVLDSLLEFYPCLVNVIDARYSSALRWARFLKFEVGPPQPYGPNRMLFCPFRATRRN